MKKRMLGLLTALALCLALLPGAAWAEETGVTIAKGENTVTLENGKFYIAAVDGNGIKEAAGEPESGPYLAYSGGTLTVHGAVALTGKVTVSSDLKITGEEGSSLSVSNSPGSTFVLTNDSTLTLDGNVDFAAENLEIFGGVTGTLAATSTYLGNLNIGISQDVAFDVQNSNSIRIEGLPSYPSLTLKSQGDITFEDAAINCPNANATLEGETVLITGDRFSSAFTGDSLTINAAKNVIIGCSGCSNAINGSAVISAGGSVQIISGGTPVAAADGTGSLTVTGAERVTITGKSSADDAFFSVPYTFENCKYVAVTDSGTGDFRKEGVEITSDVPVRVTKNSADKLYTGGELWDYGGVVPPTIQSRVTSPTAYQAGDGWVFWEPAEDGEDDRLTLDNATGDAISFNQGVTGDVSIVAKGKNTVPAIIVHGSVTIAEGADTLNTVVQEIITNADGNTDTTHLTVYGKATATWNWRLGEDADGNTTSLTIPAGTELTIPSNVELHIKDFARLKNNGDLINNGTIALQGGAAQEADAETVKGLKLSGGGKVTVEKEGADGSTVTESYSNDGKPLLAAVGTLDLCTSTDSITEETVWNTKGYRWEVQEVDQSSSPAKIVKATLTLKEGFNAAGVTLPGDGAQVTVKAEGNCLIGQLGYEGSGGAGASTSIKVTFEGGKLSVAGPINFSGDVGTSVTIAENAVVEANSGIYVGAAGGVGGKVTVNGSLTAKGTETKPAVLTGKAEVGPTGKLEVSGHTGVSLGGISTDAGKMDFAGAFTVRPGGSFEARCNPTVILASPNPAEFQEATEKEVIVVPDGYLPPNCELKFTKENKELTIPGDGTRFIISILNVPPTPPPAPSHTHKWAEAWTSDQTHHWHACTASGCSITEDSQKDGYGEHAYSGDWDEVCGVCGYTRTVDRPGSSGSDSSSDRVVQSRPVFSVTVEPAEHGKVVSDHASAGNGSSVTLTVRPDEGYQLESLTVADRRGNRIKLSELGGGKYTFAMPDDSVTVRAAFKALEEQDCPSRAFSDLDTGAWYHEATDFVLEAELMNGYSDGTFRPNGFLSRAQLSQILYNRAGRPAGGSSSVFADVPEDAWCAKAVSWAAEAGIVTGYAGGSFLPDSRITREQLVVMLWRCAGRPAPSGTALDFADAEAAGDYAREALLWAAEKGVLSGYGDGRLDPKGLATRAQAAQMLQNYLKTL